MAVFVLRSMGITPGMPAGQSFADVPPSRFSFIWVEEAAALGIIEPCSPGFFCPEDPVTRENMAVFVERGLGIFAPPDAPFQRFADVEITRPAHVFIDDFFVRGITAGCGTNPPLFCPSAGVTRGQAAVLLVKAFNL
jgi:hypothetical protein